MTGILRLEPFAPRTPAAELDDLHRRLAATRWSDAPDGAGWSLGMDADTLRALVDRWRDGYDWPAQEAALNRLPRYLATVGGRAVHVVLARGRGAAMPLLLAHGWPDSFWRYTKVIPLLADPGAHGGDPADAFDVVVPDMPGFGHSAAPAGAPLASPQVAGLWAELLTGLGYDRVFAAGGDIGSHVVRYLALDHPDRVIAVHRTDAGLPPADLDPATVTAEERAWLRDVAAWGSAEGAYAAMHRTKPQTAAAGLADSPAGLAAWIAEKLHAWSDGGLDAYTADEVLTLVSTTWFTRTIGSSMRMYAANAALPSAQLLRRVEVPSGFSLYPHDILRAPRAWLDRSANTVSVTEPARGGHFAAFEDPEGYAEELRRFFRPFRTAGGAPAA